jgi:hypothetical protein
MSYPLSADLNQTFSNAADVRHGQHNADLNDWLQMAHTGSQPSRDSGPQFDPWNSINYHQWQETRAPFSRAFFRV